MEFRLIRGKIERATEHSAAFDLFYDGTSPLAIGDKTVIVPTGVYTEFTPGFVAIIKEKSGLAAKGLEVKAGVIDADYRDEWGVVMRKPVSLTMPRYSDGGQCLSDTMRPHDTWEPHVFKPGDKIAQFIIIELPKMLYRADVGAEIITKDAKRSGGFGSTG